MKSESVVLLPPDEMFGEMSRLLKEGYDAEFTVTGNSMWPLLRHKRDCVTLRGIGDKSLKKGDIVLLKAGQGYLLHRITRIRKNMIQTTGDHNCYHDEFVSIQCVLGRVVCFTRKGKQVFCTNPLYRLSSGLWRLSFPVRSFVLRILCWRRRRQL